MQEPILWALVMNSETARILRGIQRDAREEAEELHLSNPHHPLREIMSDRPGRSFASVGSRRSAMDYASDPVRDAQRAFAGRVIDRLVQAHDEGGFDRLAVFASRPMLGHFRDLAPPALARLVTRELDKNLVHLAPAALRRKVAHTLFEIPDGEPA